ncbi:MAG: GNAT family N-acetyltransferase [Bacteroidota bacterium]
MDVRQVESESELKQILDLQNDNHYTNVPEHVKEADGFVTVRHDLKTLTMLNDKARHVIALEKGKVIGYALVMLKELRDLIPVLVPMFDMFQKIEYQGVRLSNYNYYAMGQICIAEGYRGKGVFSQLYNKHKEVYSELYDLCLTEVSSSNPRSMKAHEKVGFQNIHQFRDKTDEWNILCWDWN